jgi:hypothetical protein
MFGTGSQKPTEAGPRGDYKDFQEPLKTHEKVGMFGMALADAMRDPRHSRNNVGRVMGRREQDARDMLAQRQEEDTLGLMMEGFDPNSEADVTGLAQKYRYAKSDTLAKVIMQRYEFDAAKSEAAAESIKGKADKVYKMLNMMPKGKENFVPSTHPLYQDVIQNNPGATIRQVEGGITILIEQDAAKPKTLTPDQEWHAGAKTRDRTAALGRLEGQKTEIEDMYDEEPGAYSRETQTAMHEGINMFKGANLPATAGRIAGSPEMVGARIGELEGIKAASRGGGKLPPLANGRRRYAASPSGEQNKANSLIKEKGLQFYVDSAAEWNELHPNDNATAEDMAINDVDASFTTKKERVEAAFKVFDSRWKFFKDPFVTGTTSYRDALTWAVQVRLAADDPTNDFDGAPADLVWEHIKNLGRGVSLSGDEGLDTPEKFIAEAERMATEIKAKNNPQSRLPSQDVLGGLKDFAKDMFYGTGE